MKSPRVATSPPGSSRNSSVPRCERHSGHFAELNTYLPICRASTRGRSRSAISHSGKSQLCLYSETIIVLLSHRT
jgi:hypothetical protein